MSVPYTTTYSAADKKYLLERAAKSPKIAAILVEAFFRPLTEKLDADAGVTDTNYEATLLGSN